jgi:predicted component of type VI protein secretion system
MAKKQIDVFNVPELERHELIALQVVADPNENADPKQQALAIKVIIEKLCLFDVTAYQAGSFDETAFLNGRVFVGKQIFIQRRKNVGELPSENDKQ